MKSTKYFVRYVIGITVAITICSCNDSGKESLKPKTILPAISNAELENQAWKMEELYWQHVEKMDTVSYKKLWHDDFVGYPSFGDGVSDKSKIAIWIPELHRDTSLTFSHMLHKKALNAIDDVVIVFYDADEIWTDRESKVVRKETYKFTHTWKKYDDNWVILGGMAAKKDQDKLNN